MTLAIWSLDATFCNSKPGSSLTQEQELLSIQKTTFTSLDSLKVFPSWLRIYWRINDSEVYLIKTLNIFSLKNICMYLFYRRLYYLNKRVANLFKGDMVGCKNIVFNRPETETLHFIFVYNIQNCACTLQKHHLDKLSLSITHTKTQCTWYCCLPARWVPWRPWQTPCTGQPRGTT